jgi:cellulose 1,4-beta-cellobiosidase
MYTTILIALTILGTVVAQQIGTQTAEKHPALTTTTCSKSGCQTQDSSIVLDSNWRWVHNVGGYDNCYTGDEWNSQHCPDPVTCAKNCALDGADYPGTYGISTSGNALNIKFVTHGQYGNNIGSRVYLLANSSFYQQFHLKNREFTFDVDVSQLPCGLNGALYFVAMPPDGGISEYQNNKAGAAYGTGYCDAQCPHDMKFINGEANILDWKPSPSDPNSGTGRYGTCCVEMDIWEANSMASAYTPHVCSVKGQYRCDGTECGDGDNRYGGVCDKDGCDFNSFRMGNKKFFGANQVVDTTKLFTVVTQFITADGTDGGELSEIRRIYVQNGKVIPNSAADFPNMKPYTSVSDAFCNDQKTLFGDKNDFMAKGGLKTLGDTLDRGMTLVMSLWDDHAAYMLWLDSSYPANGNPATPGIARGTCDVTSGRPTDVESKYPDATVKFSNIKFGPIGSTYAH